jgi:CheY-like chemotaxis protein
VESVASASNAAAGRDSGVLQGKQILLAEDTQENRDIFAHMLRPTGVALEIVNDGRQAVETVILRRNAGRRFDLILMDMQMPVMDGFEAAATLRRERIETPIIALTAYAMASDRDRCLTSGCSDYLAKPVLRRELIDKIAGVLAMQPSVAASEASPPAQKPAGPGNERIDVAADPDFAPLREQYLQSLRRYLKDLGDAESEGDGNRLQTLTHRLKGTAGSYGFPDISSAAAECEQALRTAPGPAAVTDRLSDLRELIERALS